MRRPGSEFTVGGKHEPLVSPALFDEVQRRLELAHCRSFNTQAPERRFLLTGLVRYPNCGGPMMPIHRNRETGSRGHGNGELAGRNYRTGASRCPGSGLRLDVAEEALLAQVHWQVDRCEQRGDQRRAQQRQAGQGARRLTLLQCCGRAHRHRDRA